MEECNVITEGMCGLEVGTSEPQSLNEEEILAILAKQDLRKVSEFEANKLEKEAKRNWDIFYKRNETRFFKDRHWITREFEELQNKEEKEPEYTLLELGCGVGNLVFPLLSENTILKMIFACDFSSRAIDLVKTHPEYDERKIKAFVSDLTQDNCFTNPECPLKDEVDFVSFLFVLSTIHPEKYKIVIENAASIMKKGSILFFRDYGRYDMAQIRFKGGKKIQDNFYARRDGTRAYYFTPEEVESLFTSTGKFQVSSCEFVHKRTVNVKEKIDVGRIFVQAKFTRL